ncbi:MAG: hypothetical protein KGI06_04830 [Candidatus Micrarchaeota archaeon]|nr:hypothetical protein [Candidatus Micrarchaeota archaeon]
MALKEIFSTREDAALDQESIGSLYLWLTKDLKPNTVAIEIGPDAANSAMYLAKFENISRVYVLGHDHKRAERSIEGYAHGRKIENTAVGLRPENPTALRHYLTHNSSFHWPIIMRCDIGGSEEKLFSNMQSGDLSGIHKLMISVYGTENAMKTMLESNGFKTAYKPLNGILSKRSGTLYAWR